MKSSLYLRYASRSLLRGGQRTVLAIFCVAIGVMAIVALQLVGQMVNLAFSTNTRVSNGGDIQVSPQYSILKEQDLAFFDTLKQQGKISNYTAVIDTTGEMQTAAGARTFAISAVDPASYPVIPNFTVQTPSNQPLSTMLGSQHIVVDQDFIQQNKLHIGDVLQIHVGNISLQSVTMTVTIAGVLADSGLYAQKSDFMLLSQQDYKVAVSQPPAFTTLYISTNQNKALTDQANKAIQDQFPLVNTLTTEDVAQNQKDTIGLINKFLDIAGLLALLVGGVGIINTMQVLLSRRKIEIATLKTNGYRKQDLYLLFGLEAGLLGLIGGIIGAALSIGVSSLILFLVQKFLSTFTIAFVLDWTFVIGGIVIGVGTTLIFGLMPIVQAANIRPLSVLREESGKQLGSSLLTVFLVLLLSLLFCVMSILIMQDPLWGILSVYGGFLLFGLLGLVLTVVVLAIGKLPVPDKFSISYLTFVTACTLVSLLLCSVLGTFGYLLLTITLFGYLIVLLPYSWKINLKMALRNIARQRARTSTTLLALFVGVFTIGCNIVLGQNFITQFNQIRNKDSSYNVAMLTNYQDTQTFDRQASSIPGLSLDKVYQRTYISVSPSSLNSQPLAQILPQRDRNYQSAIHGFDRGDILHMLSSFEGYDLANNQFPDLKTGMDITNGRTLTRADLNTNNILIQWDVANIGALKGKIAVGDDLTVTSQDGKITKTLHIVGIYKPKGFSFVGKLLASTSLVQSLATNQQPLSIFYLRIDPQYIGKAIDRITQVVPNANVQNFVAFGDQINQYASNSILLLVGIASLSMLAGLIIIANAVALAMLERRREVGILKSVGYTSRMLLSEIIIENGIIGGVGAFLAMLLVALFSGIVGNFLHINVHMDWSIAIEIISGVAGAAILTAVIVAWKPVGIRPLEVLRYE